MILNMVTSNNYQTNHCIAMRIQGDFFSPTPALSCHPSTGGNVSRNSLSQRTSHTADLNMNYH